MAKSTIIVTTYKSHRTYSGSIFSYCFTTTISAIHALIAELLLMIRPVILTATEIKAITNACGILITPVSSSFTHCPFICLLVRIVSPAGSFCRQFSSLPPCLFPSLRFFVSLFISLSPALSDSMIGQRLQWNQHDRWCQVRRGREKKNVIRKMFALLRESNRSRKQWTATLVAAIKTNEGFLDDRNRDPIR